MLSFYRFILTVALFKCRTVRFLKLTYYRYLSPFLNIIVDVVVRFQVCGWVAFTPRQLPYI